MKRKILLSGAMALFLIAEPQITYGQEGASLNFDGIDDKVSLGTPLNGLLDGLNTFTVEAWVNPSTQTGLGCIIGNYNTTSANGQMQFLLRRDNDQYSFWVDAGSGFQSVFSGAGTVSVNSWQHIAGRWNGSEISIFVNGVQMNVTTGVTGANFANTTNPIHIGANSMNENFSGNIDQVRLWYSALNPATISANMSCGYHAFAPSLLAIYNFNEGIAGGNNATNTILYDVTNSGYNGTLINFALSGSTSNFTTDYRNDYITLQSSIGSISNANRLYNGTSGDFDNNGSEDIIVTAENAETRLYLNDGRGNFSAFTVLIPPGTGWPYYSAGDLDNDGDDDIVYASGNIVSALINDGVGNFAPIPTNLLNGTGTISVTKIADINGDGKMDIITGNNNTGATDETEVWVNTGTTGNATFAFSDGLLNSGGGKNSIAVGDVDGDGDQDIMTGSSSWSALLFLNNNNDGTFTQGTAPGGYGGGVHLLDWNQDGLIDYINNDTYNAWGVRVSLGDGSGVFATPTTVLIPNGFGDIEFADLNADGYLDVVTTYWGGTGRIYLNNGCVLTLQASCEGLGRADNCVTVADFNGDGSMDIFCGARNNKSSFSMNFLDPVIAVPLSNISSTTGASFCDQGSAVISASISNPGNISWYAGPSGGAAIGTGSTFTTPVLTLTTSYYVESVNPNSCISIRVEVPVTINELPVAVLSSSSITDLNCFGDTDGEAQIDITLNGTATSATYLWDDALLSTNEDLTGLGQGVYTMVVTDNNNCTDTISVTINEPDAIIGSTIVTDPTCNGDSDGSIDLIASGGTGTLTFLWNDISSSTTEDISGLPDGTFTVTITDDNGCTSSENATVNEPTAINGSATNTDITCNGDDDGSVDLTATGGTGTLTFLWDDASSSTTEDISGLPGGTFTVTITDDNGCTSTANATINEPAILSASGTSTDEIGGNDGTVDLTVIGGTSSFTFSWTGPNGFTSSSEDLSGLETGIYDVTVTDANGCTTTDQVFVGTQVGINEISENNFEIYPNPSTGIFIVKSNFKEGNNITVTDAAGRIIMLKVNTTDNSSIDLSMMESGVYFVQMKHESSVKTIRLVLQK
jgi:hypothetical protein